MSVAEGCYLLRQAPQILPNPPLSALCPVFPAWPLVCKVEENILLAHHKHRTAKKVQRVIEGWWEKKKGAASSCCYFFFFFFNLPAVNVSAF